MANISHWAIFAPGLSMKSSFMLNFLKGVVPSEFNELKGRSGALYSTFTLERFIREEAIHDDFVLSEEEHRSIQTFSSGEQRKALLNHLLSSSPDFLVLDNVFDMLDANSKKKLTERLTEVSTELPIIQIIKRKDNVLPFIKNAVRIENEKICFTGYVDTYLNEFQAENSFKLKGTLPPPLGDQVSVSIPMIRFTNVCVKYGETKILNNINWTINNSEFWQLTGPNGSGKTTLLTMITGDNPKAYGQDITLFGKRRGTGESIWDIKKKIGYVTPSMTTLFRGWNSVEKMVISGLVDSIGLYQKPTALQRQIADEWIDLIGLRELKHARFSTLSEGQQCMVLIARSMIKHPPLLILDEPAHGLDDYNASVLSALVNKIAKEGQTAIIYVSHRKEPGLKPKQVFELIPGKIGSVGRKINIQ